MDKVNIDQETNKETNTPRRSGVVSGWWMLKLSCFPNSRHS